MNLFTQGPREKVHYKQSIEGDTLVSAEWSIQPQGPNIRKLSSASSETVCRVSGLRQNVDYVLRCHLTCASEQEFEPTAIIRCR